MFVRRICTYIVDEIDTRSVLILINQIHHNMEDKCLSVKNPRTIQIIQFSFFFPYFRSLEFLGPVVSALSAAQKKYEDDQ